MTVEQVKNNMIQNLAVRKNTKSTMKNTSFARTVVRE